MGGAKSHINQFCRVHFVQRCGLWVPSKWWIDGTFLAPNLSDHGLWVFFCDHSNDLGNIHHQHPLASICQHYTRCICPCDFCGRLIPSSCQFVPARGGGEWGGSGFDMAQPPCSDMVGCMGFQAQLQFLVGSQASRQENAWGKPNKLPSRMKRLRERRVQLTNRHESMLHWHRFVLTILDSQVDYFWQQQEYFSSGVGSPNHRCWCGLYNGKQTDRRVIHGFLFIYW